jgi:3D (Asp-Asp-Asp) domain-containing protein
MRSSSYKWLLLAGSLLISACAESAPEQHTLEVRASAYNSVPGQTVGNPAIAAWGDRLQPGMKAIAVSRDLLEEGLDYNMEIQIEGLPGRYRVLDKMHPRWERKIDIYMGEDVEAALDWGVRDVTIRWKPDSDEG